MAVELFTFLLNASRRLQLALALGLFCAFITLILVAGYGLTQHFSARMTALSEKRDELAHLRVIINRRDQLVARLANNPSQAQTYLLEGASPTIIGAQLQTWLTSAAQELGLQISSMNISMSDSEKNLSRIGLDVEFSGSWRAIHDLLAKIEAAQPVLLISKMNLRSTANPTDTDAEIIIVQLSFFGAAKTDRALKS